MRPQKSEGLDFFRNVFPRLRRFTGNVGQCDYSFANHFMDAFVNERELLRAKTREVRQNLQLLTGQYGQTEGLKLGEQMELLFRNTLGLKTDRQNKPELKRFLKGLVSEKISDYCAGRAIKEKSRRDVGLLEHKSRR